MSVRYTRVGWQDAPSTDTPIDAANLNHMDNGIIALSEEVDTELPLLQEQINDISADIDTQIDEKIPPEVSSWLTEHVTPAGSAVVVDDTLTIQGAAADAKKAGDEISDLKDGLTAVESDVTDLKEDLSDKLDAPTTAGTSGQVLTSDGHGGQSWEDTSGGGDEERLSQVEKKIDGILDKKIPFVLSFDIIPKSYVNDNGSFGTDNNWSRTDYIDVTPYNLFVVDASSALQSNRIGLYDSEKVYIDHLAITKNVEFTIPDGVHYLVISSPNANTQSLAITGYMSGALSEYTGTLEMFNTTQSDLGKALTVKTIADGNVAGLEYKDYDNKQDGLFNVNANLINKLTTVVGKYNNNGTLDTDTNYETTDYIPITLGNYYYANNLSRGALFDENHQYVQSIGWGSLWLAPRSGYIRISVLKENIDTAIFAYYYYGIQSVMLGKKYGLPLEYTNELANSTIASFAENDGIHFTKSANLFRYGIDEIYVTGTGGSIIGSNGVFGLDNRDKSIRESGVIPNGGCIGSNSYFPVTPGKYLTSNYKRLSTCFYDGSKTFVSRNTGANEYVGVLVPEGCEYARINFSAYTASTDEHTLHSLDECSKIMLYLADEKTSPQVAYTAPYQIDGSFVSSNYLDKVTPTMQDSDFLSAMKCLTIREINKRDEAYRIGNFNMWVGHNNPQITKRMLMDNGIDFCGFEEVNTGSATAPVDLGRFLRSWQFADGFVPERTEGVTDNAISMVSRYTATSWSEFQLDSVSSNKYCVNCKVRLPRYKDIYNPFRVLSMYTLHPPIGANKQALGEELLGIFAEDTSDFIVITMDSNDFADLEENKTLWRILDAGGFSPCIPIKTKTITQDNIAKESDEYPDKQWRWNSIDQIFVSSNIECLGYDVINTKDVYYEAGNTSGATDNQPALSDHDFVYADLKFKYDEPRTIVPVE